MSKTICNGDYVAYLKSGIFAKKPQINFIYLFKYLPQKKSNSIQKMLIKRCIGLEGDTILLFDTLIYRNGQILESSIYVSHNYKLKINPNRQSEKRFSFLSDYIINYNREDSSFLLNLAYFEKKNLEGRLKEFGIYLTVEPDEPITAISNKVRPRSIESDKNCVIKEALKLGLNSEEMKIIRVINGNFFMGDNRPLSIDSREFGCITNEKIRGRAIFIIAGMRNGRWIFLRRVK